MLLLVIIKMMMMMTIILYYRANSRERIVLIGGYGGWLSFGSNADRHEHDGFVTRPDVWDTFDGYNWNLLSVSGVFGVNIDFFLCMYVGR